MYPANIYEALNTNITMRSFFERKKKPSTPGRLINMQTHVLSKKNIPGNEVDSPMQIIVVDSNTFKLQYTGKCGS